MLERFGLFELVDVGWSPGDGKRLRRAFIERAADTQRFVHRRRFVERSVSQVERLVERGARRALEA